MMVYDSAQTAARGLLGEVVGLMDGLRHEYVVVGGWSPYLLCQGPIRHPGTFDVDLLFSEGATSGALESVITALLAAGFLPSAKHHFQLLRLLKVRDYDVIFNVDLLHPTQPREPGSLKEPRIRPEMFVDHVELAFPISDWLRKNFHGVSIAAPHSGFIFKESAHEQFPLETVLPSGQTCVVNVPLMNEVALLVTKSESIASPKRPRDSFDVYLTIRQCRDRERLVVDLDRLRRRDVVVFNSLLGIRNFVKKDPPTFGHSVETYLPVEQRNPELSYLSPRRDPYAEEVLALLDEVGAP